MVVHHLTVAFAAAVFPVCSGLWMTLQHAQKWLTPDLQRLYVLVIHPLLLHNESQLICWKPIHS
jgi:hypothetical protein